MELVIYIVGGAALGAVLVLALKGRSSPPPDTGTAQLTLMQEQLSQLSDRLDNRLHQTQESMQQSMGQQMRAAQELIGDVRERLGKLDETNKQVVSVTDQLQSLQDILKNPKQRGVLGEYYLETVLKNVLPPERFVLQYDMGKADNGANLIVDAVIFLDKNRILPIDSKFSLENYNRLVQAHEPAERERLQRLFKADLKARIDETAKYIHPEHGTMDFAFMFIPSEGVYYDLLVNKVGTSGASSRDLIEYAFQEKRVIIVSPTSFMAYLQTVIQGLRSLEIEGNVREIQKRVVLLHRHIATHEEAMQKLGKSLGVSVSHYNSAHRELGKIDKDVVKIGGDGSGEAVVEPVALERPQLEDV